MFFRLRGLTKQLYSGFALVALFALGVAGPVLRAEPRSDCDSAVTEILGSIVQVPAEGSRRRGGARIEGRVAGLYESFPSDPLAPEAWIPGAYFRFEHRNHDYATTFRVPRPDGITQRALKVEGTRWSSHVRKSLDQMKAKTGPLGQMPKEKAREISLERLMDFDEEVVPLAGPREIEAVNFLAHEALSSPERQRVLRDLTDADGIRAFLEEFMKKPDDVVSEVGFYNPKLKALWKEESAPLLSDEARITLHRLENQVQFSEATVDRRIQSDRMNLQAAFLATPDRGGLIPSFVNPPGMVPLVPGRGTPTQLALTLHQMRVAGVKAGGLREIVAEDIRNLRTAAEISSSPRAKDWFAKNPGRPLPLKILQSEDVLLQTHTAQYVKTLATQSGHRIRKVRLEGDLSHSRLDHWAVDESVDEKTATLLKTLPKDTPLPTKFDLVFELEPL